MKTVLYIVRHGTTNNNVLFKYQGQLDTALNDLGRQQGRLLTDYFSNIAIDVAYSSPLFRAKQTLDYILDSQTKDIPVFIDPDFSELNWGIIEDRPVSEVSILFPELQEAYNHHPGTMVVPRGETTAQVQERFVRGIFNMIRKHPGKTIVLASHGFAIQTWLNYASGIALADMKEWCLENVAVSRFTFDETEHCTIDFIGDSHHLRDDLKYNYDWEALAKAPPLLLYDQTCRKCRQARAFLETNHLRFQQRDLRKEPLYAEEIRAITGKKSDDDRKMLNTNGAGWKNLSITERKIPDTKKEMTELLLSDFRLLRHPLLVGKEKVIFGFNEDQWTQMCKVKK